MSEVTGFSCPSAEVRHCFRYKGLRLAFSNMPKDAGSMSTKVGGGAAGAGAGRAAARAGCVLCRPAAPLCCAAPRCQRLALSCSDPPGGCVQVAVDAQGMLKVTHVLNMGTAAPMSAMPSDMLETQVGAWLPRGAALAPAPSAGCALC